jgi:hypothetical protein
MAARKRGGVAGIYDRNKKLIKTLAPIALGAIPGIGMPLAVAAGAAMGADKEGKGYFKNFDVGGAVKGGVAGYGQGATGAGIKGLLTGAAKSGVSATEGARQALSDYNRPVSKIFSSGGGATTPAAGGGGGVPDPTNLSKLGDAATKYKDLIAAGGKGIQLALPDAASDAAYMNAETNRMRLEQEQSQEKMEEERRRRIAELLMPMFTQIQQSRPSYGG